MTDTAVITKELLEGVNAFQKGKYDEAFTLLLPFAEQGELRAQLILARLYYAGHGVQQSEEKYLYWLRRSAESGDKSARSIIKRIDRNEYTTFALADEQVELYRLFGYLRLPGFFSADIIQASACFDRLAAGSDTGDATGEGVGASVPASFSAKVEDWLPDPTTRARLDLVIETLLGGNYASVSCELSCKQQPLGPGYGSEGQGGGIAVQRGIRAVTCLDRGAAINVFPGSHHARDTYTRSLRAAIDAGSDEAPYSPGPDHEGVMLGLTAGDLVLLDVHLTYRLATGRRPLRLIQIEYESPQTLWDHIRRLVRSG